MRNASLFLLASIIFFTSCNSPRYIYTPSPPNNPYFTEKGQSKLAAYYSSGGDDNTISGEKNNGLDVQGAYAISNNWALTAGYSGRKERGVYSYAEYNFFDSSVVDYKRSLVDMGGGYFLALNERRTVSFNLFGGLGFGKFSFTDKGIDKMRAGYNRFHSSNIVKWYAQPSLNALPGKYFRASFIFKFSFLHYGNISTSYTSDELQYFFLDKINNKTLFFFEPSFNMQIGIPKCDWLKIDGGFTFSTDPYDNNSRIEARSFNASVGLSVDLSQLKK
ncbi:MAG: hypothetical protein WDO16_05080 [Bacteroidota bacterium]